MRRLLAGFSVGLGALFAPAQSPLPLPVMDEPVTSGEGRFDFSLLPKAFQSNPELEMTVFSAVTDYGRRLPAASPEHPVYYVIQDGGKKEFGDIITDKVVPAPDYFARLLRHSLETGGYLSAAEHAQPATLALFSNWGSHYRLDPETAAQFPNLQRRHLIERARLVGGPRYAKEHYERTGNDLFPPLSDRTDHGAFLRDQTEDSLYFVIVSAYDLAALARNERRLVWRTTMTVNTRGVNMAESLPPLVLSAGPYFGHEMKEAEVVLRHVKRGKVELGPLEVISNDVTVPTKK